MKEILCLNLHKRHCFDILLIMTSKNSAHILKMISHNRRASFNYTIEATYEAGIVLHGTEVKSLRKGKVDITAAHAQEEKGEFFLLNANIPEYTEANRYNHHPNRPRKLLLHKKEIKKLFGAVQRKGYSIIPISIYFNNKNIAKVLIGLGKGKTSYDKRESIKQKEWERAKSRKTDE